MEAQYKAQNQSTAVQEDFNVDDLEDVSILLCKSFFSNVFQEYPAFCELRDSIPEILLIFSC
jgi:hypothetical protein